MPRVSRRKIAIDRARSLFRFFAKERIQRKQWADDSSASDYDGGSDSLLVWSYMRLKRMESKRYLKRGAYRAHSKARSRYETDLEETMTDDEQMVWLNDDEFLAKYRMTRIAFRELLDLMKDDPIFDTGYDKGRKQRPVEYQILTLLKAFGGEGTASSAPNLRDVFGTGRGTNLIYIRRVCCALRKLRDDFIQWPDEEERKEIADRIQVLSDLPNCVGIVDGTLFPLAMRPQTDDAPDYKGRKHLYTISSVIVCDDRRLIRYYVAGWPGSTHDNRIARNTRMWQNPHLYFDNRQYLIGDSAFENFWFMVSAYTLPAGEAVPHDNAAFNTCLSRARVISEHTIGLLKGRFPWLRSIRKVITEDDATLAEILSFIDASVIIHNFLVKRGLDESKAEWIDQDDLTLVDDVDRLPENDELNQPVPDGVPGDFRRTQLLYYLQDRGIV